MHPAKRKSWAALARHRAALAAVHMADLFAEDPERPGRFNIETSQLFADLSKHRCTVETVRLLNELAEHSQVAARRDAMLRGDKVNGSEDQAALHTALRAGLNDSSPESGVVESVVAERERCLETAEAIRSGRQRPRDGQPYQFFLTLGMGGSSLGPELLIEALGETDDRRYAFIDNMDPAALDAAFADADPKRTMVFVISKSFSTRETLLNAERARAWMQSGLGDAGTAWQEHFIAVTAQSERALQWGLPPHQVFKLWEWVGGRYSLWSAVGLPAMVALGNERFTGLLRGAAEMDQHFAEAPLAGNLPVRMGLLGCWYRNFWHRDSHAVIPYSEKLRSLPAYIQQLEMESNGKHSTVDGHLNAYATAPVTWGGRGSTSQHAFFQQLHQGNGFTPVDFILPLGRETDEMQSTGEDQSRDQAYLELATNCLAQSQALMLGRPRAKTRPDESSREAILDMARAFSGNRPSTTITLAELSPASLGALIALYEHKTLVQAAVWDINPFDQWGVEYGKQLATDLTKGFHGSDPSRRDPSTAQLLERLRRRLD